MAGFDVNWTFGGAANIARTDVNIPPNVDPAAPLVVLLHGTGGDFSDMSDPATHPGMNVERLAVGTTRNRGWHEYPNVGFWSIGMDPSVSVTGWAPFLTSRGYPVLNYAQTDNSDRLVRTTAQLVAILRALEAQRLASIPDPAVKDVKDRDIVLVGHSRGGIVARQALVDLAAARDPVLQRIRTCVTIHAPNQGSNVANVAVSVATALSAVRNTITNVVPISVRPAVDGAFESVLGFIQSAAASPSYLDFMVGSPTLVSIAAAEPVPGVEYFTFGGTRPILMNVRGWAFTPDSAIPQFNVPPFFWRTVYQPLISLPPPLPLPEVTLGSGDVLTAAALCRLPFSIHRDNALNHAEALWDPSLQLQVEAILRRQPLPQTFVVDCVTPDSDDPGRAIDALGGIGPTGTRWTLGLADALLLAGTGSAFFVRRADGRLVPLQRVRRRNGTEYFRSLPGGSGPRLAQLPVCV